MSTSRDRVLRAYNSGATTRREIVAITELDQDLVDLILDRLLDNKELELLSLNSGCTTGGCRGCSHSLECSPQEK